jgi:predicted lipoprotein with Yx(FWY)xxD motif
MVVSLKGGSMRHKIGPVRAGAALGVVVVLALLAAALASRSSGATSASMASQASRQVVKTAKSKTLGKTILVNRNGLTLYSLSAETHGRFICSNDACLSLWTPLVVPRGTKPTGSHSLGTIRRPDSGRIQVTYRGRPLYTFNEDKKPGDVRGNGFKDVGTWLAATPGAATSAPPAPSGYGGYGGYDG